MFIYSVKVNKTKILSFMAVFCAAIALVFVLMPSSVGDVLNNGVSSSVKDQSSMVFFLKSFGYKSEDKAVQIEEVIIPSRFDEKYTAYNELQKVSGFDLEKFAGKTVKKYTFRLLEYPDTNDEVIANILVYNDRVIGGDISSTTLGGFQHGFVKE